MPGTRPLRFTAGGHVLGFGKAGMVAATGSHALRVDFMGANVVAPVPEAAVPVRGDAKGGAAPLERVTYPKLWDGITLTYTAAADGIYMTAYRLERGARVKDIRLRYNAPLTLNGDGSLDITFESGTLTETAPVAWQEVDGRRVAVEAAYVLRDKEVGFTLGDHDPHTPLVIDPTLMGNTFLGGMGVDKGYDITVDGSGNVYVSGVSSEPWGSPVRAYTSPYDCFAAKLDPSGRLVWHTFLGGDDGDYCGMIAVDGSGNVYVSGASSSSWGSPIHAYTSSMDGFVAKLDPSGHLMWNTFLGGSGYDEADWGIDVDERGNVYVAGDSDESWGSPVRAHTSDSNYDTFVAKLDSSGTLMWNTFLGGRDIEYCSNMALDESGNVYVVGDSRLSWGTPVRPFTYSASPFGNGSREDVFVARLDTSGSLAWNTFLGGMGMDLGFGIAVDGGGSVYVTGQSTATWGQPLEAFGEGHDDVMAAKLDSSGVLLWNTFLGGKGVDIGLDIALDDSGNAYVTGLSTAAWGRPVRSFTRYEDVLVAKLDASGSMFWHTFLGGIGDDYGLAIAVDGREKVYVAGYGDASWGAPVRPYTARGDASVSMLNVHESTPDILANGSDGPVTVRRNETLVVEVELTADYQAGASADWWIAVKTPFAPPHRYYHFDPEARSWLPGLSVSRQASLANQAPREILNTTGLPAGTYTFYFGVDTKMDGAPTMKEMSYDSVEVTVVP